MLVKLPFIVAAYVVIGCAIQDYAFATGLSVTKVEFSTTVLVKNCHSYQAGTFLYSYKEYRCRAKIAAGEPGEDNRHAVVSLRDISHQTLAVEERKNGPSDGRRAPRVFIPADHPHQDNWIADMWFGVQAFQVLWIVMHGMWIAIVLAGALDSSKSSTPSLSKRIDTSPKSGHRARRPARGRPTHGYWSRFLRDPERNVSHRTLVALPFVVAIFICYLKSTESYAFAKGMNFEEPSFSATASVSYCAPERLGLVFHTHTRFTCWARLHTNDPFTDNESWKVHTLRDVSNQTVNVTNTGKGSLSKGYRITSMLILSDHPRPTDSQRGNWSFTIRTITLSMVAIFLWMLLAIGGIHNRAPRKPENPTGSDQAAKPAPSLY